jgi:hypothetical protein
MAKRTRTRTTKVSGLSAAERRARWNKCVRYLGTAGSVPAARKLAKREGFAAPAAAWVGALGKMLKPVRRKLKV